jgi:hypothetical protein
MSNFSAISWREQVTSSSRYLVGSVMLMFIVFCVVFFCCVFLRPVSVYTMLPVSLIVHSWLPLRFSLTCIYLRWDVNVDVHCICTRSTRLVRFDSASSLKQQSAGSSILLLRTVLHLWFKNTCTGTFNRNVESFLDKRKYLQDEKSIFGRNSENIVWLKLVI